MKETLLDDFYAGRRSTELPFIINDTAEIISGDYAGWIGAAVCIDTSGDTPQFLIEFGDGTDELVPLENLKLHET